jgi:glutamate-1-semialdehyde aminotransferase/acyl carrier protein
MVAPANSTRSERLVGELRLLVEEGSGLELEGTPPETGFIDLGLDSLFMTQFALTLQGRYGVKITFRQLLGDIDNLAALAAFLDSALPAEPAQEAPMETPKPAAPPPAAAAAPAPSAPVHAAPAPAATFFAPRAPGAPGSAVQALIEQQLRVMAAQLELLGGAPAAARPQIAVAAAAPAATAPEAKAPAAAAPAAPAAPPEEEGQKTYDVKKAFGAIARIHTKVDHTLTPLQQARFAAFVRRYNDRTAKSKQWTQANRARLSDPRVVSGFKPALKEIVYPIVVGRSQGAHLWDLDGNQYVDALNGFGSNFFGYQPHFVADALKAQIDVGYEVGPQTPLAGEASDLVCELTGFDRAGFCNTGSEAVMGCMRVARTVTGRRLIVAFTGSYHGIFDEVIVRGTKKGKSVPAAPGIMPSSSENILLLDYGTPEALETIRARAKELAAVLVEPIQSRRPDLQPKEFLHEVRKITAENGCALIFDEVITGFRLRQGGAQEYFGVRADLASYGKVAGAGLSIGVIAGKRDWMDALDGGGWQFGDASVPTVGVTYFAGTFVRHPLAMAACVAAMKFLKAQGPQLQLDLNARTQVLVDLLNGHFQEVGAPLEIRTFGSLWKPFFTQELPWGELLFAMMRDRGVHIWDGFPCFLTLAHSDEDVAWIARVFEESIAEMQEAGFFPPRKQAPAPALDANAPPVPGARLGREPDGTPAWYVPHAQEPGKYVKLERS